jgi:integrase
MADNKRYKGDRAKITNAKILAMQIPKSTPRKGKKPRRNINRLWDDKIVGFCVQCTTGGTKSYYYYYRDKYKKKVPYRIGSYPAMNAEAARKIATQKAGEVAKGGNPHVERRSIIKSGTLAEYSLVYVKTIPPKKSAKKEIWVHEKYIRPGMGKHVLSEIKPMDIELWRNTYVDTPDQANNNKVYIHKFFQWCIRNQFITSNPAAGIKNLKVRVRQFVATDSQMKRIGKYLKEKEEEFPIETYFIGLMIATGCRPNEIYQRRWNDIDWKRQEFTQVDTKTGVRSIQLSEIAINLLERLKPITSVYSEYCFPARHDFKTYRYNFRNFWYDLRDSCGFKPEVQMRDLRHHFASIALAATNDIATVSALLGHSNVSTTSKHYAHVLTETKQKRLSDTASKFKML